MRVQDLIREIGLLEAQDVYVLLQLELKRVHLRCAPESNEVHAAFPALACPVLISHPVSPPRTNGDRHGPRRRGRSRVPVPR